MAESIRFEVYIPLYYTIKEYNDQGVEIRRVKEIDPKTIQYLIADTHKRFRGVTQSNPASISPFKGYWSETRNTPPDIDYLHFIYGIVSMNSPDDALEHFTVWKEALEQELDQDLILVVYYPVRTIGKL